MDGEVRVALLALWRDAAWMWRGQQCYWRLWSIRLEGVGLRLGYAQVSGLVEVDAYQRLSEVELFDLTNSTLVVCECEIRGHSFIDEYTVFAELMMREVERYL
ncbi:hypothetical protein LSCM4_04756 [Leishmania orientalis]|uniref:Uncharacterized protein n=1 Tax=Leishmania orientalis TaxID=2249476 RepID=A0A836KUC7_9TRYP|nr:hypothetical protein LSCM4_04756 [Leishmania orientalis]